MKSIMNVLKTMNLPNKITLARVCLIPLFVIVASLSDTWVGELVACVIFAVASITDCVDGHIARSRNLVTTFGKFMDPLADKLLTASAFVMLVAIDRIPAWVVILILAREFAITGLRTLAVQENIVIAASKWGKLKTICQLVTIIVLYICTIPIFGNVMYVIGQILLYISLVITLYSGWDYLRNAKEIFTKGGF